MVPAHEPLHGRADVAEQRERTLAVRVLQRDVCMDRAACILVLVRARRAGEAAAATAGHAKSAELHTRRAAPS